MKYDLIAINAENASARDYRPALRALLLADNAELWSKIEPYVTPPGIAGNGQYDSGIASDIIKKHCEDHGGTSSDARVIVGLSHIEIWKLVPDVLRSIGLDVRRGKVVGLMLTKQENEAVSDTNEQEAA